jgi:hypothetical protein
MTVLLTALTVTACGGDSPRDRVDAYLREATELQRASATQFDRANEAYVAFAKDELAPEHAIERVEQAEDVIADARGRIAGLEPPAEAAGLHDDLLRIYDMNIRFARETVMLARYVPAAEDVLEPLGPVNRRLQASLRRSDGPQEQARALGRFAEGLGGVVTGLRGLDVPPVLAPPHRAQVARLTRTRSLAGRLRRALLDQDSKQVAQLLVAFRRSVGRREQRRSLAARAIGAYNDRYRKLTESYQDLRREEARLDESLD